MKYKLQTVILLEVFIFVCFGEGFLVTLSDNGPVVLGANITFKAELFTSYGEPPSGTFRFRWKDNGIPAHTSESEGHETVAMWNVSYPASSYAPGPYEVEVVVDKSTIFFWPITSKRISFNITGLLNGDMTLTQAGVLRMGEYISSAQQVNHFVQLTKPDYSYLATKATSILTYWFIDCVYYGQTTDYSMKFNYTQPGQVYNVEALVVASYEQPTTTTTTTTPKPTTPTTPVTNTTTTPSTNTTTTPSTNTTTPAIETTTPVTNTTTTPSTNTTTTPSINTTTPTSNTIAKIPPAVLNSEADLSRRRNSITVPYVCLNSSIIPPDPNKTYGYFHRHFAVKAPVSNVTVTGTNWLLHGDMLHLQVACNGSANFTYCLKIINGLYNVTGNETCYSETHLTSCQFPVTRYFRQPSTYTILILIINDVSRTVTPVAVNIYEVKKRAQLSVIVVPVTCSLIAVILIVFGVAFYIQSRTRYTIEVADFDFGQVNDMEYKTFRERLREAVSNAVDRSNDFAESENAWQPNRKYGIMQE